MSKINENAESIFLDAMELGDSEARAEFLREKCGPNENLRKEVEELLEHAPRVGEFLDPGDGITIAPPVTERPGDTIGPYKLLQQIGEGGMGVVYMAEQTEPIERRVALKIIKPGMDSRQVIARFEAERQALAMMDHPNIAKALDAGVTETGRPYFVMELVKGLPIIKYCDEQKLTPRQRLELMIPVCQAIQHAHHKGIIHRDIKPSNVLVAHYDDQPVPKVIDFGVAKAIDHRLTEKTVFTEFGQVLGTLEYMSPEQARLNQWDVDTRTDVYSLGVLLYQLLAGETPFDRQRLRSAAFDELLRIIREEDPPKPSTRASTSQSLATHADNRKTEPARLGAVIRGELDWIVMKALDKDRTRRYESANGLAADIQRHLDDEPVTAGPPLARYRLAKFVKRNKLQVIAGVAVAAALLLALVGTSIGMVWAFREQARADGEAARATDAALRESDARQQAEANEQRAVAQKQIAERELARANEVNRLIVEMLESASPKVALGADTTLLKSILEHAAQRLADGEIADERVAAHLNAVVGRAYTNLGEHVEAEKHLLAAIEIANRRAGSEDHFTLNTTNNLAAVYLAQERWHEAEPLLEKTFEIEKRVLTPTHPNTLHTMLNLGVLYQCQNRLDEAESLYEELVELETDTLGAEDELTLNTKSSLAGVYYGLGRKEEAATLLQDTLNLQLQQLDRHHPDVLTTMDHLALLQMETEPDRNKETERLLEEVIEIKTRVLSAEHSSTLLSMSRLGRLYRAQGRLDEAESLLTKVLDAQTRVLTLEHNHTFWTMHHLAHVYEDRGRTKDAVALFEKLIELKPRQNQTTITYTICAHERLTDIYNAQGRYAEAEPVAEKLVHLTTNQLGAESRKTLLAIFRQAYIYSQQNRLDDAERLYQPLIEKLTQVLGADDPLTINARVNLRSIWTARARRFTDEKRWDDAADDLVRALEDAKDSHSWHAPRKEFCQYIAYWPEVFTRVTERLPDETTLWIGRAQHHALRSQWKQAASDYGRGFRSRSMADGSIFEYAGSLLLINDQKGYEHLCSELAEILANEQDSKCGFIAARTCSLGTANDVSPLQAVEWARQRLQEFTEPWDLHVMGLAQYRAEQYVEAIDTLEASNAGTWGTADVLNWIVLSMCHHKLGHRDEARACYDKAATLIKKATPKSGEATTLPVPDWIEWHVLLPQAELLLKVGDESSELPEPSEPPDSS